MNEIKYKSFLFEKIFSYERGKRLTKVDQVSGDIAYISSTKYNNGISNFIFPPIYMTIYENKMTLSNSGSVGYLFYHDYEFVASDHVTIIDILDENVNLNLYLYLYLKPIMESIRFKYNFGREINNDRLKKECVKLPVDKFEKPDWNLMEEYIKNLYFNVKFDNPKITPPDRNELINTDNWGKFYIGGKKGLFVIDKGQEKIKNLTEGLGYPLIGASKFNNGLIGYFEGYKKLFEGNVITVASNGTVGKSFYQKDDFIATGDINVLKLKEHILNEYIAIFICTIIEQECFKFDYSRKWGKEKMEKSIIKLPINNQKNPDFDYMEKFIKSLPYAHNMSHLTDYETFKQNSY